jgi:hypothetical protein
MVSAPTDATTPPDGMPDPEADASTVLDAATVDFVDAMVQYTPSDAALPLCGNLLNCDFEAGLAGWGTYVQEGTGGLFEVQGGELLVTRMDNMGLGAFRLEQDNVPLASATLYEISFDGRVDTGDKEVGYFIFYEHDRGNRSEYCVATLDATMRRHSCLYTTLQRDSFGFGMDFGSGTNVSDIYIDNIAVTAL